MRKLMANRKRDTREILVSIGAKAILCPGRMHKSYISCVDVDETDLQAKWPKGKKALFAVLDVPQGDYNKLVCCDPCLDDLKHGWYATRYLEVSEVVWRKLEAHPRFQEINS
jgi:hypothetical protein